MVESWAELGVEPGTKSGIVVGPGNSGIVADAGVAVEDERASSAVGAVVVEAVVAIAATGAWFAARLVIGA